MMGTYSKGDETSVSLFAREVLCVTPGDFSRSLLSLYGPTNSMSNIAASLIGEAVLSGSSRLPEVI